MKLTALVSTLVCAAALTGCPDPGSGATGPEALIGDWEEAQSPGATGPGEMITFRADGTFENLDGDQARAGTYEADDLTLTLITETSTQEVPYAVLGNKFTPVAFRRELPAAGFAGNWRAEGTNSNGPVVLTLDLNADFTMAMNFGEDLQMDGTWRDEDGTLITTLEIVDGESSEPIPFDLPWHSIGEAVSLVLFERR